MIYLSSTTGLPIDSQEYFGVMFSSKHTIGGLHDALESDWLWMMDNNEYAGGFDTIKWISALLKYRKYRATCLGIPIRDKVGDALETLRRFSQYWRVVKDLGYPVAFVSQDGISPEMVPWHLVDVLFVGGTDRHKLGSEAGMMIAEARERGKWVHIGRVNSVKRMRMFWMADSVDGTHLSIVTGDERKRDVDSFRSAAQYSVLRKNGRVYADNQLVMEV